MYPYEFYASFDDGTRLAQGDDRSAFIPGKSAYTDLCLLQERGKVLTHLMLISEAHIVGVDLATGYFVIDDVTVAAGDPLPDFACWRTDEREMPAGAKPAQFGYERRVVYYRKNEVRAEMSRTIRGGEPQSEWAFGTPEITHFCVGYELAGSKIVLGVKP